MIRPLLLLAALLTLLIGCGASRGIPMPDNVAIFGDAPIEQKTVQGKRFDEESVAFYSRFSFEETDAFYREALLADGWEMLDVWPYTGGLTYDSSTGTGLEVVYVRMEGTATEVIYLTGSKSAHRTGINNIYVRRFTTTDGLEPKVMIEHRGPQ